MMLYLNPAPIKLLYRLRDENPIVIADVKDLREGLLYYILTVNEELPKKVNEVLPVKQIASLEEFFKALKARKNLMMKKFKLSKIVLESRKSSSSS